MQFYNDYLVYVMFIILIGMTLVYILGFKLKKRLLKLFGEINTIQRFSKTIDFKRYRTKAILLLSVLFFSFLAIARPQWGAKTEKIVRKGLNIIVALDVSKSMLAEDLKPNRLEKAKHEISKLIDNLKGDRIGLMIFAGSSFLQCPLTIDYGAAKMYLDMVNVNSIPIPGTDIANAIIKSVNSFPEKENKYKVIILMTDGENHKGNVIKAAEYARKKGVIIYTIGIGTPNGELIPIRDNNGNIVGYKKDKNGNPVLSKLDEVSLEKIALITGGKYYRATSGELELKKVYDDILKRERKLIYGKQFIQREDRFQWFLLPALLFLIWEILLKERKEEKEEQIV